MSDHNGAASLVRSDALLACPFCGCADVRMCDRKGEYDVICPDCQCRTGTSPSRGEVTEAWNRRHANVTNQTRSEAE
jgi:Lar family restriction alleviation protein